MNAHARFAEIDRPEPLQLLDFPVEVDTISEVQAGICQVEFPGKFILNCRWYGTVIEIEGIEQREWRGNHAIWIGLDGDPNPDTQFAARLIRAHYATPEGQQYLRAACDDYESRGDDE